MNFQMSPITFPGTTQSLSLIREYVKNAAKAVNLNDSTTYSFVLAVDEIATNVIMHGYEAAHLEGNIVLEAIIEDGNLIMQLTDTGKPYDPHAVPELIESDALQNEGGLGLMLAKKGVDRFEHISTSSGNIHRLITKIDCTSELLNNQLQQFADERKKLEILLKIPVSLGLELQLKALLKLIVAEVTQAMRAERTTLYIPDPQHPDELVSILVEGIDSTEIRVPFKVGIAGKTAETREVINVPDVYQDSRFNPSYDKLFGFKTKSLLSAPIIYHTGELMGVIQVINKEGSEKFTKEDEKFLNAICIHLGIAIKRTKIVEEQIQLQIFTKSLELAKEIQLGLVPKPPETPIHKEIDFYASLIPAFEIGGDFYDFFPLDKDRFCFIIGDVSDKGIAAALFMAMVHTSFKVTSLSSQKSIKSMISKVNQYICENNSEQMFVTAFAGIIDLRNGKIEYIDAGHEPPYILKQDGSIQPVEKFGDIVIGFLKEHDFTTGTLTLEPGETLVLYTDGITEAMNKDRHLFGVNALEKTLSQIQPGSNSKAIIETLLENVRKHTEGYHQVDDITSLVIKYLGDHK